MKKQLAIILLFCYASVLLRPLVPVVSDFLAHTFWSSDHIATVHYENGHYHLHYELKEIHKNDSDPVQQLPEKKSGNENVQVHLLISEIDFSIDLISVNQPSYSIKSAHSDVLICVPTPPPWC
jgi:mannose-6-phosphate isomerase class I